MQGVEIVDKLLGGIPEETYLNPSLDNSKRNAGRLFFLRVCDRSLYDENLGWITAIVSHTHVYHKGSYLEPPPLKLLSWKRLPNVGRETHTYLLHIIDHYDIFPEVTVFLQADNSHKSCRFFTRPPMNYVYDVKGMTSLSVACPKASSSMEWKRIHHILKWQNRLKTGEMRRARLTFELSKTLFGFQNPPEVYYCPGGCFAATRDMIRKYSLDFYRKAIKYVDDHDNPEEGITLRGSGVRCFHKPKTRVHGCQTSINS